MVREILSIGIGQCGVQLGHQVWQQYNVEHAISSKRECNNWIKDGPTKTRSDNFDQQFLTFYEETTINKFVPRNIFIDTDPTVIDSAKSGKYGTLYHDEDTLSGNEDASYNFAAGYYTVGKALINAFTDRIRKQLDECDDVQGFIISHSVGGGTGSGLGALILETLATDYQKKFKLGFEVYPSSDIRSNSVMAPYNALLATHWLLDHTQVSVVFDNEAVYELCQRKLDIKQPSYENMNRLMTKPISGITASLRFKQDRHVCQEDLKYVSVLCRYEISTCQHIATKYMSVQ